MKKNVVFLLMFLFLVPFTYGSDRKKKREV